MYLTPQSIELLRRAIEISTLVALDEARDQDIDSMFGLNIEFLMSALNLAAHQDILMAFLSDPRIAPEDLREIGRLRDTFAEAAKSYFDKKAEESKNSGQS